MIPIIYPVLIVAGRSAPQDLGPYGKSPRGLAMESLVIKEKKNSSLACPLAALWEELGAGPC